MNDVLLAAIIGGLIGIAASAAMGLVQGLYSLRAKREENLSRERQQSTQIEHEKDGQIVARRIAVRSKYLEPLAAHLAGLHSSFRDFQGRLYAIAATYRTGEDKIQVTEERKAEFYMRLSEIKAAFEAISIQSDQTSAAMSQVVDDELTRDYTALLVKITAFYEANTKMYASLNACEKDKDFVYELGQLINATVNAQVSMSTMHRRIESLLAGVD